MGFSRRRGGGLAWGRAEGGRPSPRGRRPKPFESGQKPLARRVSSGFNMRIQDVTLFCLFYFLFFSFFGRGRPTTI